MKRILLLLLAGLIITSCSQQDVVSPETTADQNSTSQNPRARLSGNHQLLESLNQYVSLQGDRLKFNSQDQLEDFYDALDNVFKNWSEESSLEDSIHGFTHEAVFHIEEYLGYTTLQSKYTDEFYRKMDLEGEIDPTVIYFPFENHAIALNKFGEMQIGNDIIKYVSQNEYIEIIGGDDALLAQVRNNGFFVNPSLRMYNLIKQTRISFGGTSGGAAIPQGLCEVNLKTVLNAVQNISPNTTVKYWFEAEVFNSSGKSVSDIEFTWNFGDGSNPLTGFSKGGGTGVTGFRFWNEQDHVFPTGTYTIIVEAQCVDASQSSGLATDCNNHCDDGIQPSELELLVEELECEKKSIFKTFNKEYTDNGDDYRLAGQLYAEVKGHGSGPYRTRIGANSRFYKRKGRNNEFKSHKPDNDLEVEFTANVIIQETSSALNYTVCDEEKITNPISKSKKRKKVKVRWSSSRADPSEFPAKYLNLNSSSIVGIFGVNHAGNHWTFNETLAF